MSRKEKMKIYHGIPKSVTDEHTMFYASFDYTKTPSTDNDIYSDTTKSDYGLMPSGGGLILYNENVLQYKIRNSDVQSDWTLEYVVDTESFFKSPSSRFYGVSIRKSDATGLVTIFRSNLSNQFGIWFYDGNSSTFNFSKPNSPYVFIRLTHSNNNFRIYFNGKLVHSITKIVDFSDAYLVKIGESKNWGYTGMIAELSLSNIDRGDYFPNLPQDFIDGKAIIKPRMNQQQIKGDPLYSQVTELLVDSSAKLPKSYSNTPNSDGTYTHLYKPELSVLNANLWNSTSKLIIKGLNGEVISGVIDTDTALGRVLSVTKLTDNSARVTCDCFSKISNGDTLNFANINSFHTNSWVDNGFWGVVSELNSSSNSFVVTTSNGRATIPTEGDLIFETTASSSSPIVKTQDGTTVVGTWSGLGTNEATFTLGTNTDLSGKDLYVTYSLNIPNGNSDFPELPYSVDRAYNETGLEMKPVSEIVIEDDFRGKIANSSKECPHTSKALYYESIAPLSAFMSENKTFEYELLSKADGRTQIVSNTENGVMCHHLFSFNLVEMVERKLGCEIPSRDKVQWLKDNVISHTITHYGYGICPSGNKLYLRVLNGSSWTGTWEHSRSSSITPTKCSWVGTGNKPEGFVHLLVYTDASDGVTPSKIETDYVKLEITLKIDSTFTTLYCDNKRAREDSCNPVLVQKETKTVKRYLPSKECFVTECSYTNPGFESRSLTDYANNNIYSRNFGIISTSGTDINNVSVRNPYRNLIANLGIDELIGSEYSEETLSEVSTSYDPLPVPLFIKRVESTTYPGNNYWLIPEDVPKNINSLIYCDPRLNKINGEIYLYLYCAKYKNGVLDVSTQPVGRYKLPNRPLIK